MVSSLMLRPVIGGMLGGGEIMWICIAAIVLFGASQIPKLARSIGKAKKEFERGLKEGEQEEPPAAAADTKPAKKPETKDA